MYYAPGMMNLISISHLDNLGHRIEFHESCIDIWDGKTLELSVPQTRNAYRVRGEVVLPESARAAKLPQTSWHLRCGHIGNSAPLEPVKKNLVEDLNMEVRNSGSTCDACLRGKHTVRHSLPLAVPGQPNP